MVIGPRTVVTRKDVQNRESRIDAERHPRDKRDSDNNKLQVNTRFPPILLRPTISSEVAASVQSSFLVYTPTFNLLIHMTQLNHHFCVDDQPVCGVLYTSLGPSMVSILKIDGTYCTPPPPGL